MTTYAVAEPDLAAGPSHDAVVNPRESMRVVPAVFQGVLTRLTGQPLTGQTPWRATPTGHVVRALISLVAGVALSALAVEQGGGWLLMLLPGWMVTLHAMRNIRMMLFHQSAHSNLYGAKRLDGAIGRTISILLLVEHFAHYKTEHTVDHHSAYHMTMRDPTVKALVLALGLHPRMTPSQMWRRLLSRIASPRFHAHFFAARIRSHFSQASVLERAVYTGTYALAVAVIAVTNTWIVVLLAWFVPLTVFFQVATVLRLVVKHVFPSPGGPRRGKVYFASLSYGVFLGERVPAHDLRGVTRSLAWVRWVGRMLFVHFPARYLVLTGDTVCHDYHHRHPTTKDWPNYLFARQLDIAAGHPGWPPYREVWSLRGAIDLVFASLAVADPAEYDPRTVEHSPKYELYAAFDD
jgi:hypothetical protein